MIISSAYSKQRQLKFEKIFTILIRAFVWALTSFVNTFELKKRLRI